jgi:hypothetical protein
LKALELFQRTSCLWGTAVVIGILFMIFKEIPAPVLVLLIIVAYLLPGAVDYGKPE